MTLRKTDDRDLAMLKALWETGFSDTEEEREDFFASLYPLGQGYCLEEDGNIESFCFALPLQAVCREKTVPAAYLYGIVTHPDHRGTGRGRKLLEYVHEELSRQGISCTLLFPETEALRPFYETLGYRTQPAFQQTVPAPLPEGRAEKIDASAYAGLRRTLLGHTDHIRYSLPVLEYEGHTADYFALQLGSTVGCAGAYLKGDTLLVDEILPDGCLLPALMTAFSAKTVRLRSVRGDTPQTMCRWMGKAQTDFLYLAFPFD